jgi:6-phosphogluconate dehydrogenase
MRSFLIEITATIFKQKDDSSNNRLVDMILDKAGSKGTGKWTSQDSMDLPVAVPGINAAVALRDLSDYKDERLKAAALFEPKLKSQADKKDMLIPQLHDALCCATILAYAQGLEMLQVASKQLQMDIPLMDVVKIWRGGCIIRSESLNLFYKAFKKDKQLPNLLLNKKIVSLVKKKQRSLRKMVSVFAVTQVPASGLMSALGYLDAYCSANMPTNLIQAQRDFFGAHTYQRIDKEGSFHTEWGGLSP